MFLRKRRGLETRFRPFLPRVGPFASLPSIASDRLPNFEASPSASGSESAAVEIFGGNERYPTQYNLVNIRNTLLLPTDAALFLWANVVNFGSGGILDASGNPGADSTKSDGGDGASGGGAGGVNTEIANGGSNGNPGQDTSISVGGAGFYSTYQARFGPYIFPFPAGGGGGSGGQAYWFEGFGGTGTAGAGGGGGGGGSGFPDGSLPGGGGGGGGKLVCLVCNQLLGSGGIYVFGGNGGGDVDFYQAGGGGGGGGGSIYVAARRYLGTISPVVFGGSGGDGYTNGGNGSNGTAQIYEITRNNTLVLRSWTDSWNNL